MTDAIAALLALVGIALVALWLSPLEAQALSVGNLFGADDLGPRISTLVLGVGACVLAVLVGVAGRRRPFTNVTRG